MSAYESSLSALRSRSFAQVSSLSRETERSTEVAEVECTGRCVRGILWASLIEGAGLLTIGWVVHLLRAMHG